MQPLLLVFEDLHWIDSETQALLDSLVERPPTARLLLLVNYRPEYQHSWGSKTYYTQLHLDQLPPASAEVLQALLGTTSRAPLTPLLIERTEGNPFFLEESAAPWWRRGPWWVRLGLSSGADAAHRAGAGHGAGGAGGAHRPAVAGGETPPPDRRGDRP